MLNLSGLCRHFLVVMSRMQQLLALFGVFTILSLSVSDAQRGDVHVSCEKFKEGQTSHCNCTIDKTEADSDKCIRSHPVQEIIIDRTRDGISTHLCDFSNYTSGTLRASHRDANCSSHETSRDEEYILKFETIANRSRDEDAHIDCNVACFDTEYNDGLTKSHDGVPIQFENTGDTSTASENTRDTSTASVSATETAPTPENTGDTSTTSAWILSIAVAVITVLAHLAVCILLIVEGVKCEWFSGDDWSEKVTAVVLYALYFPGLVYIGIAAVKDWWPFKNRINGWRHRTLVVVCMIIPQCVVVYLIWAASQKNWPFDVTGLTVPLCELSGHRTPVQPSQPSKPVIADDKLSQDDVILDSPAHEDCENGPSGQYETFKMTDDSSSYTQI